MSAIQSWWDWCTESFGHMFAGVAAPLLLFAAFVVLVIAGCKGGDDASGPQPPRSDVAGACVNTTPEAGSECATSSAPDGLIIETATPVPPTPTPAPRAYTVQPGDSLYLICADEAPDMALDACVAAIVDLSDLAGPDEIAAGQTLRLPPASATTVTSTRRPATATPKPVIVEPTAEVEDEPEAEAATAVPEETEEPGPAEAPSDPEPTPEPSDDDSAPQASLVAIGTPAVTPDNSTPTPSPTPTPVPTLPPGFQIEDARLYTVKPGDNLLTICAEQVPDISVPDCVYLVVLLNSLSGPDEVYAHQGLFLP